MDMNESNRRQTIQAAITLIAVMTLLGVVLSLTSCRAGETNTGVKYSVKELAYLSDVKPALGANAVTAVQESALIGIGKSACHDIDSGTAEESVISGLVSNWTELEARVMVHSASKYFCK